MKKRLKHHVVLQIILIIHNDNILFLLFNDAHVPQTQFKFYNFKYHIYSITDVDTLTQFIMLFIYVLFYFLLSSLIILNFLLFFQFGTVALSIIIISHIALIPNIQYLNKNRKL